MRQLSDAHFTPPVLDNATGFDARHRERLRFHFETTSFDDGPFEDVFLVELNNRTIRLDGARGDVLDLYLGAKQLPKRQVDLALRFASAVRIDLHAQVMIEDEVSFGVVNPDFPEQSFGVSILFDHWSI